MLLAQISEAQKVIDHAATASDRWLFLASLVIIMLAGSVAIRWLVNSLTAKDAVHVAERAALISEIKAEHLECRAARKEDQQQFLSALEKKDSALLANTEAVRALTAVVTRRDAEMHPVHGVDLQALIRDAVDKASHASG